MFKFEIGPASARGFGKLVTDVGNNSFSGGFEKSREIGDPGSAHVRKEHAFSRNIDRNISSSIYRKRWLLVCTHSTLSCFGHLFMIIPLYAHRLETFDHALLHTY